MTIYRELALAAGTITLAGLALGLPAQAEDPKAETLTKGTETVAPETEAATPTVDVEAIEAELDAEREAGNRSRHPRCHTHG